jgi:glycosyltransferase involved in cell wall biosynthesis
VYIHARNYGYGGNQKTCYTEALKAGATIVVMVHPDYQYDPRLLPEMIKPIEAGQADVVFGSRMLGVSAYRQGMPWWKYLANKSLTWLENRIFGLNLSEFHTGYRAYRREVLEAIDFRANSDQFIFDQEIVAQIVGGGFRITEIPVPVRYFPEASSAGFVASTIYGLNILWLLLRYQLHRWGIIRSQQFELHRQRYRKVD